MRYKLKKWYPSLDKQVKEGDIANLEKSRCGDKYAIKLDPPKCILWIDVKEVENNPEFWEKVVEKDYEILSFKAPALSGILDIVGYGTYPYIYRYSDTTLFSEKQCLDRGYKIHSVKRFSDGEVFTVGDNLYLGEKRPNEVLSEIKIIHSEVRFRMQFQIDLNHSWSSSYTLDFLQHAKEPLFTTEDGVDVYEGEEYYVPQIPYDKEMILKCTAAPFRDYDRDNSKRFKSKELAKEWVIQYTEERELRYSKADIRKALKSIDKDLPHWIKLKPQILINQLELDS